MAISASIGYPGGMPGGTGADLAANVRRLREARGLSQARISRLAGLPRPTWASLESGGANPTLSVLTRAASALQVSVEELIGPPRTACRLFPAGSVKARRRRGSRLAPLLPEPIPGLSISRLSLEPAASLVGVPHTAGTREYLTCDAGSLELVASGEHWELRPGDTLVFRGDQRHTYRNLDARRPAAATSVVCFAAGSSAQGSR